MGLRVQGSRVQNFGLLQKVVYCFGRFVHRDLKSANVVLDQDVSFTFKIVV